MVSGVFRSSVYQCRAQTLCQCHPAPQHTRKQMPMLRVTHPVSDMIMDSWCSG
jgi:hypothetical protein